MIIQSKKVWLGNLFYPAQIELQGKKITRIYPYGEREVDEDFGTNRILPGFIDIHTHGAYGFDTNDGDPKGLKNWVSRIPEEGVTSILPTTVTQMPEVLKAAVQNVAAVMEEDYQGAEILGIHFEGPFLDMKYKGAQPPEAIQTPTVEAFEAYQNAANGQIKYITLAPEHDANLELTRYCSSHGVAVSMGHSSATAEEAMMGIANGAISMTHVYNGMTPLHHRNPGLVGMAYRMNETYGEIIGDGHHSNTIALYDFYGAKGPDHAILITDSLRAKYCPPGGNYQLGGHDIEINEDGLALLKGTNTIAGSTLRMNEGLRIVIEEAGVPVQSAINSCTINPARVLGVQDRKGRIAAGYDADLVVLDQEYHVIKTWCRGTEKGSEE